MCGIAGFVGSVSPAWLAQANQLQAHRGPDDRGTWHAPGIGLAHTRLAILDISPLGHQPMASDDGRWQLVFNGEIYNFRELRAELEALGHSFRSHSDTEVLLALWQQYGQACLQQLNGMFALAIWDAHSRELVIARDASGIKPLFWAETAAGLVFASEAKALAPLLPTPERVEADQLLQQLSYLWCPGPATLHPAIRSLEPGGLLACAPGASPHLQRWCAPIPPVAPLVRSRRKAIAGTRHRLRQAVHRQMVADVPLGAFLSGGLDSSAVVAFARELNPSLQCFTIHNPGAAEAGFADDLPYARRVARHLGVSLHEVEVQPGDLAADLRWMLAQLDAPVADPAPLNVVRICRAARQQGITVLLSGAGGDDLFTGYRRHWALQSERLWSWWPRPWRRQLRRCSGALPQRISTLRRMARAFEQADADPRQRLLHYFRWGSPALLRGLLSERLQRQLLDPRAEAPLQAWLDALPPDLTPLQEMLALEQRFFLADHNLHYTDAMSMAAGVEVRVPFLDPDLLGWSWRLPDGIKQRGGCGKWVLKRAMEPFLPRDVIYRPKTGFGAPLRRWLQHDLQPLLREQLDPARLAADGLFNPTAVQQLLDDDRIGHRDAAYTIWSILCITLWSERQRDMGHG
jgi:asparagine synthase (glutamine-hydrolysing)